MMRQNVVSSLCRLAQDFERDGNVSMGELLRRSAYAKGDPVNEDELELYLRQEPELVESWLMESDNTRWTRAWYFLETKNSDDWTVGRYPDRIEHHFQDKFKACAFYVKQFVSELSSLAYRR